MDILAPVRPGTMKKVSVSCLEIIIYGLYYMYCNKLLNKEFESRH